MGDRKKGFSSVWKDWKQIDDLLPAIAKSGFQGIEPTFIPGAIPSPKTYQRETVELKARCRDLDLEIPSMRGGKGFWDTIPSPDSRRRSEAIEHGKRACECLALLGGKTLLVVPGQMQRETPYREHWKRVVDFPGKSARSPRNTALPSVWKTWKLASPSPFVTGRTCLRKSITPMCASTST